VSIEPPKSGKGTSGPIIILVFVSILLLVVILIFGMLAFVIDSPGGEDNGPDPATALTAEDFTIVSSATGKDTAAIQVDVVVMNTADEPVEDAQIIVQCEDGGYVSAIRNVPPLESEAKTVVQLQLSGTGNPACSDPDIAFSSTRGGN
jgi:hypothetical protein